MRSQICNVPNKSYWTLALVVCNILPQNLSQLKAANTYDLTQSPWVRSLGASEEVVLAQVSHEAAVSFTVWLHSDLKLQLWLQKLPKLTHLIIGRSQILDGCCPEEASLCCHLGFSIAACGQYQFLSTNTF